MIHYLRKHRLLAAFSVLALSVALCWLWFLSAPIRGDLAARIDVHRGKYRVLGYGLADRSRSEYARCLRERYGIEFRAVAGCVVSDSLVSYVDSYHSVVANAAYRKFGRDVFNECAHEADPGWKATKTVGRPPLPAVFR